MQFLRPDGLSRRYASSTRHVLGQRRRRRLRRTMINRRGSVAPKAARTSPRTRAPNPACAMVYAGRRMMTTRGELRYERRHQHTRCRRVLRDRSRNGEFLACFACSQRQLACSQRQRRRHRRDRPAWSLARRGASRRSRDEARDCVRVCECVTTCTLLSHYRHHRDYLSAFLKSWVYLGAAAVASLTSRASFFFFSLDARRAARTPPSRRVTARPSLWRSRATRDHDIVQVERRLHGLEP